MDLPYFWFLLNTRDLGIRVFFNDLKLFYFSFTNFIYFFPDALSDFYEGIWHGDKIFFGYLSESSIITGFEQFKKHFIKDLIISQLF
jgi:hypothetical protein